MPGIIKKGIVRTIPIEDIGIMVLDHADITITQGALAALLENTVAVITCDERQTLKRMWLPLVGNTLHQERFRSQLEVNIPVKQAVMATDNQSKNRKSSLLVYSEIRQKQLLHYMC